jgi:SdrD B-like domain
MCFINQPMGKSSLINFTQRNFPFKAFLIVAAWLFSTEMAIGQAGPCGTTITVTNASNPSAQDGRIVLSGITGSAVYIQMGITGSEMQFEANNVTNASRALTGLGAGTYTIQVYKEVGGSYNCGWTSQTVTVGANAVAACAGTEIGGFVFQDVNANGQREVGEAGASGIVINAYNAAGTLAATQTSSSTGVYKFTGLTAGQPYRLEYVWSDTYLKSGAAGSSSGTSIQFVTSGSCAANFGINLPENYCQTNNPYVITPCYINGNPQASAVAPLDVMVTFPYRAANNGVGVGSQNFAPIHVATATQMGATWAVAYQKTTKYAFAGAVMRRFAGFGPLGTGGIYKMNMTTPATPSVSNWINVKNIGINTGADTRNATAANTLSPAPGTPAWDAEAFNKVGKVGIGGMDFNDKGDTLWLMNLADRKLYGIKNVNPSVTPVAGDVIGGYSVTLPVGYSYITNANDFRPWAVKYYKGLVYIAAVCSGESTPWDASKIHAYILSFNPANPAAGFSYVMDFPLNYARFSGYNPSGTSTFYPWVANTTQQSYASQPMATDIEFDTDGSIILAIADRGGFQTGNQNYYADPTATNTGLEEGNTFGDILRFCKSGGSYIREGNAGCAYSGQNPFTHQEFYWGEHGPVSQTNLHFTEIGAGGIASLAGSGAVLMTAQDPYGWYAGGTIALSNTSGGDRWRYTIYDSSTPGASGKAAGLGDLEILCDLAPIEIGNRVWVDNDQDGIQDAGEPGISGVTVKLYNVLTNTLVATTTTDASGNYKFTTLAINTQYRIEILMSDGFLGGKNLTNRDIGTNDLIDNDAQSNAGIASITLTTGTYGENNHSYDFGFNPCNNVTIAGTVGSNQSACAAFDPVAFTSSVVASGGSGGSVEYQWYQSTTTPIYLGSETQWTAISGATAATYDAPSVSATTYFVRLAKRTVCNNWIPSNTITITVTPINYTVTATNNGPICAGATANLTATTNLITTNLVQNGDFTSGNTGFQSDFQYTTTSQGCGTGYYVVGNPPQAFTWAATCSPTSGASTQMMYVDNAGDAAPDRRVWYQTIPVLPNTTYTFQTYAASIYGGNPARLYLSVNGTAINTPTTLSTTTCSWSLIQNTWNSGANTSATIAIVNQNGDCSGNDFALDKISFAASSVEGGTWAWAGPSGYTSTTQNPSVTNAAAGVYTATYSLNGCSSQGSTTLTVYPLSVGGTVSPASQTICTNQGIVPTQHTLSGVVGTILRWEYQTPGSAVWNDWGGGGSTTAPSNCCFTSVGTWKVRAIIQSNTCPQAISSEAQIIVVADPSVSIASNATTVCTGGTVILTATPSDGTGTCTVQWQSSSNNSTWNDIGGATGNSYTSAALTTNTYFRARINCLGANCDQGNATSVLITVIPDPTVSVLATATGVCVGGNVTLNATPVGGVGTCTVQWQSSSDGTTWSPIGGATGNSYVTPALSTLARYRAQINCSGNGCCN